NTINGIITPRFINNSAIAEPAQESADGNVQADESDQPFVLEYYTAQPRAVNPRVLTQLVTAGAQIVSVTCETRTLEDVYASAMGINDQEQTSNETSVSKEEIAAPVQSEG